MNTLGSILLRSTLLLWCTAAIDATPIPSNDTVVLPSGSTNHGDPDLMCKPAKATDILLFLVGNYLAHAATTRIEAGESIMETVIAVIGALLLPGSGIRRGLGAIRSKARFAKTDIETAARAGALCTLMRREALLHSELGLVKMHHSNWFSDTIHGSVKTPIPDEYTLVSVPRDAIFQETPSDMKVKICSNYNAVKILVSLAQSIYSCVTLYQTRGDQLSQFGYAAFGLTVAPYAFMSVINLLGSLMCPEYPALYLVESEAMREARQAQEMQEGQEEQGPQAREAQEQNFCLFEGTVGKLNVDYEKQMLKTVRSNEATYLTFFLAVIPLAFIGGLSKFQKGDSTQAQRVWVIVWEVCGVLVGGLGLPVGHLYSVGSLADLQGIDKSNMRAPAVFPTLYKLATCLTYSAPAIGGFTVVSQMISVYGVCIKLS